MWSLVRDEKPVKLGDLAHRHRMTTRTLELKFSRFIGKSARELLHEMRMDFGRQLLRTTSLPVGEIALRCGYAEAPSFSTAFRRSNGRSPRAWRQGE
ncbi:MAG: helix-turn-helix transcriptional regulator [Oceanipulchritudo sp.]